MGCSSFYPNVFILFSIAFTPTIVFVDARLRNLATLVLETIGFTVTTPYKFYCAKQPKCHAKSRENDNAKTGFQNHICAYGTAAFACIKIRHDLSPKAAIGVNQILRQRIHPLSLVISRSRVSLC